MRRERVELACRERGHLVRLGLALMLEEDRQVGLDHVPQRDVGGLAHLGSIADDTWPEETPVAMVTDPVCGMRIDEDDAAATAEYEGRTYYFCSEACRDSFVSDPASYAA